MCRWGFWWPSYPFWKEQQNSFPEQNSKIGPWLPVLTRVLTWWGKRCETCGSNSSWTTYFGLNCYSPSTSTSWGSKILKGACVRNELMVLACRAPLCVRTWTRMVVLSGRVADRCCYLPVNGSWMGFLAGLQGQRLGWRIPRQMNPE